MVIQRIMRHSNVATTRESYIKIREKAMDDAMARFAAEVTPYPDEQIPARLAAVLMFPKREVQNANVEQAGKVRRPKKSKGNLHEMPSKSPSEKHQPLRILPA